MKAAEARPDVVARSDWPGRLNPTLPEVCANQQRHARPILPVTPGKTRQHEPLSLFLGGLIQQLVKVGMQGHHRQLGGLACLLMNHTSGGINVFPFELNTIPQP